MFEERKEYQSQLVTSSYYGNGNPIVWENYSLIRNLGGFVEYSPYRLPNWKQRLRDGLDSTTELRGQNVSYTGQQFDYRIKFTADNGSTWSYGQRGDIGVALAVPGDSSSISSDEADSIAREMISQKVLAIQRQFQAGVFLGELGEVIRLIRNPAAAIFEDTLQYCDRVRKRARIYKRLKDRRKMLTDSWLQYSFGVAPLFNDIHNAADAASKIITYRMPRQGAAGYGRSRTNNSQTDGLLSIQGPLYLEYGTRNSSNAEVKYKAQVAVSNDTSKDNLESLGLTWGNFLPTVWEIIPYSFLVDYFTNCGKVIDSLAINDSRVNWCYRGEKLYNTSAIRYVKGYLNPSLNPAGYTWEANSGGESQAVLTHSTIKREGGQALPVPSLRFKLPFSKPLKVANMIALLSAANSSASSALRI